MSYCRLGPDSDVYVYQWSGGGFNVHVAARRITGKDPTKDYSAIGLSRDEQNFYLPTAEETVTLLESLKAEGYLVPERAFARLKREMEQ